MSSDGKELLIFNRSLLDQNLNFEAQVKSEEDIKYQDLCDSEDFGAKNFDFGNINSLLERQRKILESLKAKEKVQDDKKNIVWDLKPIFYH